MNITLIYCYCLKKKRQPKQISNESKITLWKFIQPEFPFDSRDGWPTSEFAAIYFPMLALLGRGEWRDLFHGEQYRGNSSVDSVHRGVCCVWQLQDGLHCGQPLPHLGPGAAPLLPLHWRQLRLARPPARHRRHTQGLHRRGGGRRARGVQGEQ